MSFLVLQQNIADYLGEELTDNESLDLYKFILNTTMQKLAEEHPWRFLKRRGSIKTMAPYETGTCDVTLNSTTVSPSGAAVFTYEMVGGLLRVTPSAGATSDVYEIVAFDGTDFEITPPYRSATEAGLSFSITKSKYVLPMHVAHVKVGFIRDGDWSILGVHPLLPDILRIDEETTGHPTEMRIVGYTERSLFDTGTCDVTNGSVTVSGFTGTLDTLFVGKTFQVQNDLQYYTIKAVDVGGGTITLNENFHGSTASGVSFEIEPRNSPEIMFENYQIGDEFFIEFPFTIRHPYLVEDSEKPLFPAFLYPLVYHHAYWWILEHENEDPTRIALAERKANSLLSKAISQHTVIEQPFVYPQARITAGFRRFGVNPGMLSGEWGIRR